MRIILTPGVKFVRRVHINTSTHIASLLCLYFLRLITKYSGQIIYTGYLINDRRHIESSVSLLHARTMIIENPYNIFFLIYNI